MTDSLKRKQFALCYSAFVTNGMLALSIGMICIMVLVRYVRKKLSDSDFFGSIIQHFKVLRIGAVKPLKYSVVSLIDISV